MSMVEVGGIYPIESNIIVPEKQVLTPDRKNTPKLTIISGIKHTRDMEAELAVLLVKTGRIRREDVPPKVIERNWPTWKKVFTTI